jgi:RNA polymerase sigma-70 factor (ECF subfamily)
MIMAVRADLLERAQAGDEAAFGELFSPYRRELQVHCYRMLGSLQDAEDVLQEVLLAAWQDLPRFERRSSLRTWLYQIATHRCLNALRSARRQPRTDWPPPGLTPPEPSRLGEVLWLEPYPDAFLEGLPDSTHGPEGRYEAMEAMSLAFITAVQLLPPRQRAVLILRDALGFPARDVARMLDSTEESVTSALKRARATMQHHPARPEPAPVPAPTTASAGPGRPGLRRCCDAPGNHDPSIVPGHPPGGSLRGHWCVWRDSPTSPAPRSPPPRRPPSRPTCPPRGRACNGP